MKYIHCFFFICSINFTIYGQVNLNNFSFFQEQITQYSQGERDEFFFERKVKGDSSILIRYFDNSFDTILRVDIYLPDKAYFSNEGKFIETTKKINNETTPINALIKFSSFPCIGDSFRRPCVVYEYGIGSEHDTLLLTEKAIRFTDSDLINIKTESKSFLSNMVLRNFPQEEVPTIVNGLIYETFVQSFDKEEGTNKLVPTKTFEERVLKMKFNNVTNQDFDLSNYKSGKMIRDGQEVNYLMKVKN